MFLVAVGTAYAFAPKGAPEAAPTAPPPTAPASTAAAAPPPAVDGSDVSACQDGVCEVRVNTPTAIPLDPRFGLGNLRVVSVAQDSVTVTAEFIRGSSFDGQCGGPTPPGCSSGSISVTGASDTEPAVIQINGTAGYRVSLPALVIDTETVQQGVAVLRLGPPNAVDGVDLGACWDGTCTVRISGPAAIPLDPRFGMRGDIRVLSIAADAVDLSVTPEREDSVQVGCGDGSLDTCPTRWRDGTVESAVLLAGYLRFAEIAIGVAAVDQDGAVLQLKPTRPSAPPDS
jgi:hypothetical protein